jgi:hypothetical protein
MQTGFYIRVVAPLVNLKRTYYGGPILVFIWHKKQPTSTYVIQQSKYEYAHWLSLGVNAPTVVNFKYTYMLILTGL